MVGQKKDKKMRIETINKMLKHQSEISELDYRFGGLCADGFIDIDNVTFDDIIENAYWVKSCFEEEGHRLYEGRLGYYTFQNYYKPDKDLIKQYNQIKYFIKKWEGEK